MQDAQESLGNALGCAADWFGQGVWRFGCAHERGAGETLVGLRDRADGDDFHAEFGTVVDQIDLLLGRRIEGHLRLRWNQDGGETLPDG